VAPLFLLALALLAGHVFIAACLQRLARRSGCAPAWWAWVPVLNLALPARLAGRSVAWSLLLLLPGLNVLVWGLLWAEACARLGQPVWLAWPLCIPVLNLAVLARLAGLTPARTVAALGLVLAVSAPAALAAHRGGVRARARAALHGLGDPDPAVRRTAAAALARAGAPAMAAPRLAAALQDPDESVRAEAARGLQAPGPEDVAAVDALVAALGDSSGLVRGRAARGLWTATGGRVRARVPPDRLLAALLESAKEAGSGDMPDPDLVLALAAAGRSATPQLAAALGDADARVRWHAAAALMQLRRGAREAAPALRRAMDDGEWAVRNAAGRALEDVVDKQSVPMLAQALTDPSPETRYHVARALARVGPGSAAAVPVLEAALRDPDWEVRMEAAWALSAVGPAAAATEPALRDALRDPDPQVRASAAWALAGVGGARTSSVAALRQVLGDEDRQAREAAAGALARVEGRAR
jgi:HEAT repeat protein